MRGFRVASRGCRLSCQGLDGVGTASDGTGTGCGVGAGVIHTDFEAGFICAEVMAFDDLKEFGSVRPCLPRFD